MRTKLAAILAVLTASCAGQGSSPVPEPSSRYAFWRPAPVVGAAEPAEILKASAPTDWQEIPAEDLLILDFADGRRVTIQLAPAFAPVHVANIRSLARAGWWGGGALYRVQDNYVAQWGLNDSDKAPPAGVIKLPPAEYDRPLAGLSPRPLGYPDSYAPLVGHAGGWPVAYDPERGRAWLAHCYGMVGAGRDLAPDTGLGGELYAVIGHAPRHLDLNIALVGRVIDGLDAMSARPRGTEALGFYKDRSSDVRIERVRLAADLPAAERPRYEVLGSETEAFSRYVTGRANRGGEFFQRPAGGVDLCNVNVPVRKKV
jgi:peptidylprolyl isomerase